MLTDDKTITTEAYWRSIYEGKRDNASVDASNNKRPANAFDRFQWLADQVEGPRVLDVGSGHATTMKRVRAMHKYWEIICSDQTPAAKKAANWDGIYKICSAYELTKQFPKADTKWFNSVTASQMIEYLEFPDRLLDQAKILADYFICTIPDGEMKAWSQLKVWDEQSLKSWLSQYGEIVHFDKVPGLMLAKLKF